MPIPSRCCPQMSPTLYSLGALLRQPAARGCHVLHRRHSVDLLDQAAAADCVTANSSAAAANSLRFQPAASNGW